MKIATWNVNSLRVRLAQVLDWLQSAQPDILALQETKTEDRNFPVEKLAEIGYHSVFVGQKTYNGVALLSRQAISDPAIVTDLPGLDDPQRRVLATTVGGLRVLNLYVPNGQSTDSPKYLYKLNWLEKLHDYLQSQLAEHRQLVVLGDFNIAPEDRDVHDPAEWRGKVLCSEAERAALRRLLDSGTVDVFRLFEQDPGLFSWWDYRAAGFRRNRGLRIDLILASHAMGETCSACWIDKTPRRWERPSDHAPVVAEFQ